MLCHHENALQNADECHDCANVDAFGSIVGKSHGLLLVALVPGQNSRRLRVSSGVMSGLLKVGAFKTVIQRLTLRNVLGHFCCGTKRT